MRRCFAAVGASFALLAAPASAEVRALAEASGEVALAGDRVLVFEEGVEAIRVRSVPFAGGAPETVWSASAAFEEELDFSWVDASAERVAFVVLRDPDDDVVASSSTVYAGPPGGPFEAVASGDPAGDVFPVAVQVDGSTLFVAWTVRGFRAGWSWEARGADGSATPVRMPPGEVFDLRFAGDLAAGPVGLDPGDDAAGAIGMFDWRTGEERVRFRPSEAGQLALRADGTLAVEDDPGVLLSSLAAPRPRLLPAQLAPVAFAGDVVVGWRSLDALRVLSLPLDGSRATAVGPRALSTDGLDADASGRIAWIADGCLIGAQAGDGPVPGLPPGPCRRAWIRLDEVSPQPILRRRGVPVRIRCVAAPVACSGTARLRGSRPTRFRVPVGERRRVRLAVGRRTRRVLVRRFARNAGYALIYARVTVRDPAGRRSGAEAPVVIFRDRSARRCAPTCRPDAGVFTPPAAG